MTTMIENGVTLTEVARVMKTTVAVIGAECAALQLFIGEDWAQRPAISEQDAHGLVSGRLRRDLDERNRWAAHLALSEAWEADREKARRAAAEAAYLSSAQAGQGDPAAGSDARAAGLAAVEEFERANPVPTFNEEATSKNWFGRVKDAIAG